MPVGVIGSVSNRAAGLGLELSLDYVGDRLASYEARPWKQRWLAGLLLQYEHLTDGANRFVGGGQVMWSDVFGLEAGAVWRGKPGDAEWAARVAPFVSFAFVSLAARVELPLAHTGTTTPSVEFGLSLALKFPAPLNGDWPSFKIGG